MRKTKNFYICLMTLLFTMTAFAQIDGAETTGSLNIPYTQPNPVVTPVPTLPSQPVVIPPAPLPVGGGIPSLPPTSGSSTPPSSSGAGSIPSQGSSGGYTPPPPTPPIQGGSSGGGTSGGGGSYAGQPPTPPTNPTGGNTGIPANPPNSGPPIDPPIDPCTKIKLEIQNANFAQKLSELNGKTGLKSESGFSQSKDGPFAALPVSSSTATSDGLSFPNDPNTIGYMHTHLDDYLTGNENEEGAPEIRQAIRTFSPPDILAFVNLLRNAQTNNIPVSNIYGIMVSSVGTYELKFNGDINTVINSNFISNSIVLKAYKMAIKKYGLENGLLIFLRDTVRISGIGLYKLEKDGSVTRKIAGTGSKATNQPCN